MKLALFLVVPFPFESADDGGVKSFEEVGDGSDVLGVESFEGDWTISLFSNSMLPIYSITSLFDESRIQSDDAFY